MYSLLRDQYYEKEKYKMRVRDEQISEKSPDHFLFQGICAVYKTMEAEKQICSPAFQPALSYMLQI